MTWQYGLARGNVLDDWGATWPNEMEQGTRAFLRRQLNIGLADVWAGCRNATPCSPIVTSAGSAEVPLAGDAAELQLRPPRHTDHPVRSGSGRHEPAICGGIADGVPARQVNRQWPDCE